MLKNEMNRKFYIAPITFGNRRRRITGINIREIRDKEDRGG
jgi:hypothetical protein